MITYRVFKNADPPRILRLWNACQDEPGFGHAASCDQFERFVYSKPYFERKGLIVCMDDDELVGIAHAGFGCRSDLAGLDKSTGVVCMLLVHPRVRKQGIGAELLHRAEAYLREGGAQTISFGSTFPHSPFYLGLYGGSRSPGILAKGVQPAKFLSELSYEPKHETHVYQVVVDQLPREIDSDLKDLRRQVEIIAEPDPMLPSWWHACIYNNMPSLRYQMTLREPNLVVGKAWVWEMVSFSHSYGRPSAGLSDIEIHPEYRRIGFGRLMAQIVLRHLRELSIGIVESQFDPANTPAIGLFQKVGFHQVGTGITYQLKN